MTGVPDTGLLTGTAPTVASILSLCSWVGCYAVVGVGVIWATV